MGWYVLDEHESKESALRTFMRDYLGWSNMEERVTSLKSSPIRDGVYFAAVQADKEVRACVFLVRHDKEDRHHCVKFMDESYGPGYYECPKEVFDLLTPLREGESAYAEEWRRHVTAYHAQSERLGDLKEGTRVRFDQGIMISKQNLLDHYTEDEFIIHRSDGKVTLLPVLRDPARMTMPIDVELLASHAFEVVE